MAVDLAVFVRAWKHAADEVIELGRQLDVADFARPSDLPGWDVQDLFAHLAAIEAHLAGEPDPEIDIPAGLPHVRDEFGALTERGVRVRRGRPAAEVIDELARHVATRWSQLSRSLPPDPGAPAPFAPTGKPWTWETLLRNRVIDMWMHQQDIRRAVGRPGGFAGPDAEITIGSFRGSLPYVLGKRVAPAAGTTVVWEVTGQPSFVAAVRMGADGRASALPDEPADADLWLVMDAESFVVLSGGRRAAADLNVSINGDLQLAERVLAAMPVTP